MRKVEQKQRVLKSISASLLISLGVYALLNTGYSYFAMALFSFGLYLICLFNLCLFTGICGYASVQNNSVHFKRRSIKEILVVLCVNLVIGYAIGLLFSTTSSNIVSSAGSVVKSWSTSFGYFIRSCACGSIMFLAVHTYKKGSVLGIFLGVPLFILCGFQHCIANIVIMGCARTISFPILLAVLGNWLGAVLVERLMEESDHV